MTVTFLGDVFLPEPFESTLRFDNYIPNLEYPITDAETPAKDKVVLRAKQSYLEETFGSKPNAVCLANNHIMDYGVEGFNDTLQFLTDADIPYYGAGKLVNNCNNPLVIDVGDTTIGLCGYVCDSTSPIKATKNRPGVVSPNLDRVQKDIARAAASGAELQIVSLHWGEEEIYLPKPDDVTLARQILNAGADFVIGHHAHRIQPIEQCTNGTVFYGLGNCIMPNISRPAYFDDSGEPEDMFEKTQRKWNRRSLTVTINPRSCNAFSEQILFENGVLKRNPVIVDHHKYWSYLFRSSKYDAFYRICNILNDAQLRFYRVIEEPSRLKAENIKSFLRKHVR